MYTLYVYGNESAELLRRTHRALFEGIAVPKVPAVENVELELHRQIERRLDLIHFQIKATVAANQFAIEAAVEQFSRWMDERAIVRVLGAGRARLAAAIPANRLAHGGARVYLDGAMVPMPHSLHGGGIIAASASGQTPSVLSAVSQAKDRNKDIQIVGIAARNADRLAEMCNVFIGISPVSQADRESLSALADIEEYSISELLDALVVAAGKRLGYTDATWRLGHEDLGPATGPYDHIFRT